MKKKTIHPPSSTLTCVELCAGAGGQALGLAQAGFEPLVLVDNDEACCATLQFNRPEWRVVRGDLNTLTDSLRVPQRPDLVAGGLPCPPFSIAGKKLGEADDRNLFPAGLAIIRRLRPRAVMIENVKGFLEPKFAEYRSFVRAQLEGSGYGVDWRLLNASAFGVPQLRPRVVIVAIERDKWPLFTWPEESDAKPPTVGESLYSLMAANGWEGAGPWARQANGIAPTIVGGSKKHGGPDLGPTRAKKAWAALGVNAHTVAEEAPSPGFSGMPRLTVPMVARLQGFPDDWVFVGRKTAAYRQVGNAFPPPVAFAVADRIRSVLTADAAERVAS